MKRNQIYISAVLSKKQAEYWKKITTLAHRSNAQAFKMLLDFYIEKYEDRLRYVEEMNRLPSSNPLAQDLPGSDDYEG